MLRKISLIQLAILIAVVQVQAEINSPPKIIKQPPNDELLFKVESSRYLDFDTEKRFIIECEAESHPAPSYRWTKNGKVFDWHAYDDRMLQQPGRGTLVITSPRDEDAGQYQCFANNKHGIATSNSVFVRKAVLNALEDEMTETETPYEGEPFKLECRLPFGWPKPNVYWLIRTIAGGIKSINNSRMTLDPDGNLWFSNVTRYDASHDFYYLCATSSAFLNQHKLGNRVLLDVIQLANDENDSRNPVTRQYLSRKNEVALRGKMFELYCIYGGTPLPQIICSKDGRAVQWDDRITQGNYGKSLVIKDVSFEDRGSYTCEASNGVGNPQSHTISLDVLAEPYFRAQPKMKQLKSVARQLVFPNHPSIGFTMENRFPKARRTRVVGYITIVSPSVA